jgi:ABC-type antimicrobial peptide transport system permease subunit
MLRSRLAPGPLTDTIRALMAARDPDIPVDTLVSLDDIIGDALLSRRVTAITLTVFSVIALLLASLGLYGVLAYYVTQRTHEIGVRMALGAGKRDVLMHVLWRSALMVGPGLALGLIASVAGTRLIARFLYQVPPTDPVTFATVSLCLAAVAFAASAWPALRAARIDPMQALRGE